MNQPVVLVAKKNWLRSNGKYNKRLLQSTSFRVPDEVLIPFAVFLARLLRLVIHQEGMSVQIG